jgi:glycosyltransferase involved in cell wall biosynthesis
VVVISEGQGRDLLEVERDRLQLRNLILLDYQQYSSLPDVLASADVLVTVLERDAGRYSVPSKVLNYLCAARPVLGIMPPENEAAATLLTSGAGVVVSPEDHGRAVTRLLDLLAAHDRRAEMGAAGRRYAEETFDIASIAARFESVLGEVVEPDRSMSLVAPRASGS